jgi:NTE family protein
VVGEIGSRTRLGLDFYQPVDPQQRFFVQPSIAYQRNNVYVFQNDQKLAEFEVREVTGDLAAGVRIGTLGQAKLGWRETSKSGDIDIGLPLVPGYRVRYGGWFASVDLDHMDEIYVPRSGWAAAARYFESPSQRYAKLDVELRAAYPLGKFVLQGRLSYVGSPVGQLPEYDATKLGGFLNLSAFARDQLIGDDASYAGLRIERILGVLPLGIRGDMRLGLALEASRMGIRYTETTLSPWQNSIGVYLGGETPLGPVFIGYAYSTTSGYSNAYLTIGTH